MNQDVGNQSFWPDVNGMWRVNSVEQETTSSTDHRPEPVTETHIYGQDSELSPSSPFEFKVGNFEFYSYVDYDDNGNEIGHGSAIYSGELLYTIGAGTSVSKYGLSDAMNIYANDADGNRQLVTSFTSAFLQRSTVKSDYNYPVCSDENTFTHEGDTTYVCPVKDNKQNSSRGYKVIVTYHRTLSFPDSNTIVFESITGNKTFRIEVLGELVFDNSNQTHTKVTFKRVNSLNAKLQGAELVIPSPFS